MKVKHCFKGPVFNDTGFGFHGTKALVFQELDIFGIGSDGFFRIRMVSRFFFGKGLVFQDLDAFCWLLFRIWIGFTVSFGSGF